MYRGKRYRETVFGQEKKPNLLLRMIISVSLAVIISFGLIMLGARLGEKTQTELAPETTAPVITTDTPAFRFKEVEAKKVFSDATVYLLGEKRPDTVSLEISDENGKLNCITPINSLLYGNTVSPNLRPIEALLYEMKAKADRISVRFSPFINEGSQSYADLCSEAVVRALSENENVDEIVIRLDGVSVELAKRLRDSAGERVSVGGVITADDLLNEVLVREYYSALDFLILDLTDLDIKARASESDSVTSDITTEAEEATDPSYSQSVESAIGKYGLMMVKYSIRPRVTCKSEGELAIISELCETFDLCGYEIDGEKK